MIRKALLFVVSSFLLSQVDSAQQQVQLSDSYLPVAMQIIAHLTDQMTFEVQADSTPKPTPKPTKAPTKAPPKPTNKPTTLSWTTSKPTSWTTSKPTSWTTSKPTSWTTSKPGSWTTSKPTSWTTSKPGSWTTSKPTSWTTSKPGSWTTSKPTSWTTSKPTSWTTSKPASWTTSWPAWTTTSKPYVTFKPTNTWWTGFTTKRMEQTTPHHKPGLYAPFAPPKPSDRFTWDQHRFVLLPVENQGQYTILQPQATRTEEPLLSIHHEEIKPLMEPSPEAGPLLPPHYDVKVSSRSDGYVIDDISEESLQYLSDDVRDMIKMAKDPLSNKVVDVWEGVRQGNQPVTGKAKLSGANLRLLLLYDLLSRDAKRQRLSDYSGFSPDVMKNLVESSKGGAAAQLRMALSKMVERHDCGHDYANNRAKEMVIELGKEESGMSKELRYLQPLIYKM